MLSQIPTFRLPETVIEEECGYILDLGIHISWRQAFRQPERNAGERLRCDLRRNRRAARQGLEIPGRREAAKQYSHRHRLAVRSVAFEHVDKIGKNVIVIGGGNTAMDCCRTSRRLGGEDVKVIVRRLRRNESVALGKGRRDARRHPDLRESTCRNNSSTKTES